MGFEANIPVHDPEENAAARRKAEAQYALGLQYRQWRKASTGRRLAVNVYHARTRALVAPLCIPMPDYQGREVTSIRRNPDTETNTINRVLYFPAGLKSTSVDYVGVMRVWISEYQKTAFLAS